MSVAWPAVSFGVVSSLPVICCCATERSRTVPLLSVTTTKSPPITGSPWYVRSKGTYCRPSELTTLSWTNCSSALANTAAGVEDTNAAADRAASACAPAVGGGAAAAVLVRATTAAQTVPAAMASLDERFNECSFPSPRGGPETCRGRNIQLIEVTRVWPHLWITK